MTNSTPLTTEESEVVDKLAAIDTDDPKAKKKAQKLLMSVVHPEVVEEYERVLKELKLLK